MPEQAFWENRYQEANTPWDLGDASPYFRNFLDHRPGWFEPGKIVVPGCGLGHDAALFAEHGFNVYGVDFSETAVAFAQKRYGHFCQFRQVDFFDLQMSQEVLGTHQFDYVLEHTCFCAIDPSRRVNYRDSVLRLLRPKGYFLGVFWEHDEPDGPPYSVSMEVLMQIFTSENGFAAVPLPEAAVSCLQDQKNDRNGSERLLCFQKQ